MFERRVHFNSLEDPDEEAFVLELEGVQVEDEQAGVSRLGVLLRNHLDEVLVLHSRHFLCVFEPPVLFEERQEPERFLVLVLHAHLKLRVLERFELVYDFLDDGVGDVVVVGLAAHPVKDI